MVLAADRQKALSAACVFSGGEQTLKFILGTGIILIKVARIIKQQAGKRQAQRRYRHGRCRSILQKQTHSTLLYSNLACKTGVSGRSKGNTAQNKGVRCCLRYIEANSHTKRMYVALQFVFAKQCGQLPSANVTREGAVYSLQLQFTHGAPSIHFSALRLPRSM